jgi:hypothetical protein
MEQQVIRERLTDARAAVEQACTWLLSPSPATLDRCSGALASAAAELTGGGFGAGHGDPQAMAEAWHLQRAVRRAGKLLENANRYHSGWNRIRTSLIEGYQPGAETISTNLPGRIDLRA